MASRVTPPTEDEGAEVDGAKEAGGVAVSIQAIIVQLVRMDAHLDTLSDKLCQVNTCVGRIEWW